MNINMVRDADNDAGFYAAACSSNPLSIWHGANLYVSSDGGASYSFISLIANESTMGHASTALGNFQSGNMADEINSVNVNLSNGSLSSTNNDGLLSGVNTCVLGDEIIFFRDAVLQPNGSYTLTGFLRGRRGSEYAMSSHTSSDRFVLFDTANVVRVPQSNSDIGSTKLFKPVSVGRTLAATTSQSFTNLGTGLMPYAPVQLGGGRNSSSDIIINWVRRNRIGGEWRDSVDVINSEASESYRVLIYSNSGYSTIIRTIDGISSPTTTYTAAQQTTDFGSTQATIYFKVAQISAIVGVGHYASGSV